MNSEWLEKRMRDIDTLYYKGSITRDQRDEQKAELGQLYSDHLNRLAVIEWRRSNDKGYRGVAGFYGVVWEPDRDGDVFQKGSLDLGALERSPDLLFEHKADHRLGRILDVDNDSHGAFVTSQFDLESSKGRAARTVCRERLERNKGVYASVGVAGGWKGHVTRQAGGLQFKTIAHAPVSEFSVVGNPRQPKSEFLFCS
jgi:hypothetical protein